MRSFAKSFHVERVTSRLVCVVLFAMLIIQAPAGDRRNWTAIRSWAAELPAALQLEALEVAAL